jgi:hypothetical protein
MIFDSFILFDSLVHLCRPAFITRLVVIVYSGLCTVWIHNRFFKPPGKNYFLAMQLELIIVYNKIDITNYYFK